MEKKLKIDMELCSGCGLCKSVCIRDNIDVDEIAFELESNCFECGHCMAVCPEGAINLISFKNCSKSPYSTGISLKLYSSILSR